MSDVATEQASGPSFELGSVNVDSLKAVLDTVGTLIPWTAESDKVAYHERVAGLGEAGDPTVENTEAELSDAEKKIAELEAQLAEAQANAAPPAGN